MLLKNTITLSSPLSRVYVLCDLHLYRLYEDYSMKKKAPIDIGDILAISLSSGPDQAIVIHCAVSRYNHSIHPLHTSALSSISRSAVYSVYKIDVGRVYNIEGYL